MDEIKNVIDGVFQNMIILFFVFVETFFEAWVVNHTVFVSDLKF